eukprot:m.41416 g.41416  ORF g.41416 m.41416 type:complete len:69 (-) comp14201_c0_seq1:139-345(-)
MQCHPGRDGKHRGLRREWARVEHHWVWCVRVRVNECVTVIDSTTPPVSDDQQDNARGFRESGVAHVIE